MPPASTQSAPSPIPPPAAPSRAGLSGEIYRIISRLGEFEKAIQSDRMVSGQAVSVQAAVGEPQASSSRDAASPPGLPGPITLDLTPLRESLMDPRAPLMKNAEALSGDVDWKLPGHVTEHVALGLVIQNKDS